MEDEETDLWELIKKFPHTVTDEDLGTVFCIRCGLVTEEQIFHPGGGWYGSWRHISSGKKPRKKKNE